MADPQHILRERFQRAIVSAFGDQLPQPDQVDPLIRPSGNAQFGDYQANVAMSLGKTLGVKPRDVAQAIVGALLAEDLCEKVEVAGPGFINLYLHRGFLAQQATALMGDPRLGVPRLPQPQTVVIDYAGPNLAKEMHIGHIRSTVIGDALSRVLEFQGHRVIRQNHLGDWGTQFGMMLENLLDLGWDRSEEGAAPGAGAGPGAGGHSIADLDALYVESKRRYDADLGFAERARKRVVALQGGDERTLKLWRMLIEESIRHMNAVLARLDVRITDRDIRPESFYNPMLPEVIAALTKAGILQESQGAKVVFVPGFAGEDGSPLPLLVQKSDGGYLYATTDLAGLWYRVTQLRADRIVYTADARQAQHFAMVFQTARMAGWAGEHVRLDYVPFGTILGKDRRPFKAREGGTVKLASVLDEAEARARAVIEEKNPDLPKGERDHVAHVVGIGAIKYADLANDRIKDYVFDWERMLAFEGNTAPYLQYSYVRIQSIFRKGELQPAALDGKPVRVLEPGERQLVLKLLQFPTVVDMVAQSLEPHRLATYLFELAASFHQFYEACPVLTAEDAATRDSRLVLCELTARVLQRGLGLMGIGVVEQM